MQFAKDRNSTIIRHHTTLQMQELMQLKQQKTSDTRTRELMMLLLLMLMKAYSHIREQGCGNGKAALSDSLCATYKRLIKSAAHLGINELEYQLLTTTTKRACERTNYGHMRL